MTHVSTHACVLIADVYILGQVVAGGGVRRQLVARHGLAWRFVIHIAMFPRGGQHVLRYHVALNIAWRSCLVVCIERQV